MAEVKITALPLASSVASTDLVVVVADPSTAPTTKKSLASTLPISTLTQTALDLKAPLASPALTSIPTAPTAAADTSSTQLATTAFVVGQAGNTPPAMDGVAYIGTSLRYARQDHVHPTDTNLASLSNPIFIGQPEAPTASVDTSTTQLATCAFVVGQAGSDNPVMNGSVAVGTSLRYSRQDHVHPTDTSLAPLASPTFTGTAAFGSTIQLTTSRTPASASDTGNTGEICWDADYVYVCTATNTWKRASISTW